MKCISPYYVTVGKEHMPVGCGRCPNCKLRRVQQWAFRLVQEDKVSSSGYFITLTYDTEHVPISDKGFMTLRKRDFQLFMKRLRKKKTQTEKIRYYAVGEYGTIGKRPHYHAIIFNVKGCKPIAENENGVMVYTSKDIDEAWSIDGKLIGRTEIQATGSAAAAYCAKYIDKGITVPEHENDDRQKEFSLMSKGIGKSYLDDPRNISYHRSDLSRNYLYSSGNYKISMPEYYKKEIYTQEEREIIRQQIIQEMDEEEIKERLEHVKKYSEDKYPYFMKKYEERRGIISKFKKLKKLRNGV